MQVYAYFEILLHALLPVPLFLVPELTCFVLFF